MHAIATLRLDFYGVTSVTVCFRLSSVRCRKALQHYPLFPTSDTRPLPVYTRDSTASDLSTILGPLD